MSKPQIDRTDLQLYAYVLLVIAVALRFYRIGSQSLWFDEAFSFSMVSNGFWHAVTAENNNPPVYYTSLYLWTSIFGYSEAALRSLSAVCSCLALFLFWRVGNLLFRPSVALVGLAIAVFSSFHIYYAQEARCYGLLNLILFSLTYFAIKSSKRAEFRNLAPFVFFAILSLYTHFVTVFYVATFGLYLLFAWRKDLHALKAVCLSGLVILIGFFPWLLTMMQTAGEGGQIRKYLLLKLPQTYSSFLLGDTFIPMDQAALSNIGRVFSSFWIELVLALLLVLLVSVNLFKIKLQNVKGLMFAAVLAFVPVTMAFLVSFKVMMLDERYVQFSSFFFYLLLAYIFLAINNKWSKAAIAGIYSVILLIAGVNYYSAQYFGKEQWRELVAFVEKKSGPDPVILFDVGYMDIAYEYYRSKPITAIRAVDNYLVETKAPFNWEQKVKQYPNLVLIRSHYQNDLVLERLQNHFTPVEKQYFPRGWGIEVFFMKAAS